MTLKNTQRTSASKYKFQTISLAVYYCVIYRYTYLAVKITDTTTRDRLVSASWLPRDYLLSFTTYRALSKIFARYAKFSKIFKKISISIIAPRNAVIFHGVVDSPYTTFTYLIDPNFWYCNLLLINQQIIQIITITRTHTRTHILLYKLWFMLFYYSV